MDVDEEVARADLGVLYVWAEPDSIDYQKRGRAKAEIERRRREYEEEREKQRQEFENSLFNAEGVRDAKRKQFEERLAKEQTAGAEAIATRQMEHATRLADTQDKTATRVASATVYAAVAAGLSAFGTLATVALEVLRYLAGK